MRRVIVAVTVAFFGCVAAEAGPLLSSPYSSNYTLIDLGGVANVPANYGGIAFLNSNTLLLGGAANGSGGVIDEVAVTRDINGNITGFGSPTQLSTAPYIDGGLAFGPGGDLFFTGYNTNTIGEIRPSGSSPAWTEHLSTDGSGVTSSVGTLGFIPAGFNGAGNFVVGSYSGGSFYVCPLTVNGAVAGTYTVGTCTTNGTNTGGPEGIIYVPLGSTDFTGQNVLISNYTFGGVQVYGIDSNGLPTGAATNFITGLTGVEGAVLDPVTNDFLFSTYGGGNQIYEVQGFSAPSSSTPEPATFLLIAGGLAAVLALRRVRS